MIAQADVDKKKEFTARRVRIAGERSTISRLGGPWCGVLRPPGGPRGDTTCPPAPPVPHEMEVGEGAGGIRARGVLGEPATADLREAPVNRCLGFRRTGRAIDEQARSLVNGLLRTGRLESEGPSIRKSR